MSEIQDKLAALSRRAGLMTGAQWARQRAEEDQRRRAGAYDLDRVLPGKEVGEGDARFYLIRSDFPLDVAHGTVELGAVLSTSSKHIAFSACDPELEDLDPRATLFMDTETTGLAGGAGTVAFLVGVGYFTEDAFRLDQCFMRDFDEEEPMLRFLAELFATHNAVVGYNSKSFDLPLLRTRFIQNRIPFRLDGYMHYDAMHAARRIWKDRLGSCTLGAVEEAILGVRRAGDVPGHLIPQFWFDYLRSRDARPLTGVFQHHQTDILSLVALTGLVSQLLEAPDGGGFEYAEDRLSIVRLHFRQKHYEDVVEHALRFLESEDRSPLRRQCLEMLAFACKRLQRFEEMARFWERLIDEFPSHLDARLELAKHCEHRLRDLGRAEALCLDALDLLERRPSGGEAPHTAAVRERIERIRGKRARGLRAGRGDDLVRDAEDNE
ncbi:MAG TPA: ribonuclease H-like domain-containing protein, partial [Candidatus Hydrogenedentes bacterium]|nr:ribonuclease H-like domain-containing protein [Candidatus Hydrogenedentota bacterium]